MRIKLLLTSMVLAVSFNTTAEAVTVTFEDIATTPKISFPYEIGDVVEGYHDIHGWTAAGQVYSFPSGGYDSKFFLGMGIGRLTFDNAPVIFEGTFFKSFASGQPSFIDLFYQGKLVYSLLDSNTPTNNLVWIASGYSGFVDAIELYGGQAWAIDDLTYSISAVPEPSAYIMFLIGLGLLVSQRGRIRQMEGRGYGKVLVTRAA